MPLYDEIEIEDMTYDSETLMYSYPCPCGDRFKIYLQDLWEGEDEAGCDSCTLYIEVIYDEEDLPQLPDDDSEDDGENESVEKTTIGTDSTNDEAAVSKSMEKLSVSSQWTEKCVWSQGFGRVQCIPTVQQRLQNHARKVLNQKG